MAALLAGLAAGVAPTAHAQSARLNGFVTDGETGEALELVNVTLHDAAGDVRGAVTNRDGLYHITGIPPGRYVLRISYLGFAPYADTLDLDPGAVVTRNVALRGGAEALGEVVVQAERDEGAARVTAGQQTIRPAEIALLPTPDVAGDLASALSALPVSVSTGDRGGQLFIRGGEPTQNLVLLDGIVLYQPFHLLGAYSAFPADILARADVYAGGFSARFGERTSSVIDVWTREGSKRGYAGSVTASPFIATALLEGPIVPGRVSFLASARRSMVEELAGPLVGRDLPFAFGDAFAKVHAELSPRSRLALTLLATEDRGTLRQDVGGVAPEAIHYANRAGGLRYLLIPRTLPVTADVRLAYSRHETNFGPLGAPIRTSYISNAHLALDATFTGERVDVDAGGGIRLISAESALGGLFQETDFTQTAISHLALYVEPEWTIGALRVRPGARLEFYAIRLDPVLEPRLRVVWSRGPHEVSAATGIYHQEIVGLTDGRDAASIFTAWTHVPADNPQRPTPLGDNLPRAAHALLGYRLEAGGGVELSVEGFYKDLDNLFVPEWSSYPRQTTRLTPAEGRAFGFDTRAELRRGIFYGYVNYGLSNTRYTAEGAARALWYGDETPSYRPPHDRRHQLNVVLSAARGAFDGSIQWAFGSGLPFSRPVGFDGFVIVDDVGIGPGTDYTRRVIYERPYNALLPTYHRLDVAVSYERDLGPATVTARGALLNAYDRRNLFYADVFTLRRVDQLPLVPSLGLKVAFD